MSIPENDRLNGCLDEINVEFVEREATPRLLMKLSKLKHIMLLGWFGQVATVVVHPSTLGLTTVFTDWVTIMYVELLLVGVFISIVYSNSVVFDQIPGSGTEGTDLKNTEQMTDHAGSQAGVQE